MKYGERLKAARTHAKLTQGQLAERCSVAQPTISELETTDAIGSSYTARFARACGVSVDWLADEIGEMIPNAYQTSDPKMIAVCKVMEDSAEYVKDAAVEAVLQAKKLADRARENGGNNGTHG